MMYPVPFASPADVIRIAREAEALGYYAVMGNDHMTTQRYVRREFAQPPNFYEPLVTYAAIAGATDRIRLMTGVIVLPMRHPVVLAKQVATLDQFSGGRVILGVGVGAYREEFEALFPDRKGANRGEMVTEGVQALRVLFSERRATFAGRYYRFEDVEMYPKPLQPALPIYIGGNAPETHRRVAAYGDGWLPAVLTPEEIRRGLERIQGHASAIGRDVSGLDVAPQFAVSIGRTQEEAADRFLRSRLYTHLVSLQRSTLRGQPIESFGERNLLGSPEDLRRRIAAYAEAGVTHLSGLLFTANTVEEFVDGMRLFAHEVMPAFAE